MGSTQTPLATIKAFQPRIEEVLHDLLLAIAYDLVLDHIQELIIAVTKKNKKTQHFAETRQ